MNAREILTKYKAGQCTAEEKIWLESWYINLNEDQKVQWPEIELDTVEKEMMKTLGLQDAISRKLWPKIAVAASVLIFISFALYFIYPKETPQKEQIQNTAEVLPGSKKAILTLASGKRINLQDAKSGDLAKEGNVLIKKTADGQLIYDMSNSHSSSSKPTYNAIETPRSGTYQVILPDKSVVWLNAASRLRFPSSFSGSERKVELTGEAYFEVAKNPEMPFKVVSNNQVVEVLGTHFNINSYKDEPVSKTTLLEGSVKITSESKSVLLKPGEQAELESPGHFNVVAIDVDQAIAWKNGVFSFKRADLKTVMRQIARWYDVEIDYEDQIPEISFTGKIYRNVNLQEALKSIGYLNVHYTIKGKRVLIAAELNTQSSN